MGNSIIRRGSPVCVLDAGISISLGINVGDRFSYWKVTQTRDWTKEKELRSDDSGEEDNGEISLHALKGVTNNKIIKVEGRVKDKSLMILIDSGSTHNFLDEGIAGRLKCPLSDAQPLSVIVTNGGRVLSNSTCHGFNWEMQGEEFEADPRLLQLGGCDMVLGVDWMKGVSPINFDFNRMEVFFEKGGKRMTLQRGRETGTYKMIIGKSLHKAIRSKWSKLTQLFSIVAWRKGLEK